MRKAPLLLPLVVAALLAAGCGSSSKNSSATTGAEDAMTTTAATTTADTTAAADTTATSTIAGKIDLKKADSSCKAMIAFGSQISKAMQSSTGHSGDLGDSAAKGAALFAAYVKAAPSEIKADMQAYADAFGKYAKALAGIHYKAGTVPSVADRVKLAAAAQAFSSPALQKHSAHLQAWATKHCGVGK